MSVADTRPTRAEAHPTRRRILGTRPHDDDAALVLRVQAGDEEAFAAIFKRHHASLLSYCRHMLGNRDEGEDALQQAFIKAHQALLRGSAPRELRPWLYAIARNCCLSAIATRRPTAQLQDRVPALAGLSEEVHQREDLRELLAGIGRLPEDQRSALLLAELDDLSHQAIATVVGCQVSKVKALIYQARTALIADRDARNTPCQEIREELTVARGGELRRGPLRRHLKLCAGCRDFQLAVGAQRESLACVLPVAPSAGLVAAVLGHAGAHAVGAAGIGGAGAVPVGGAAGTSVGGASTAGATTLGGSVVSKLAVGGAIAALAATGTVAAHRRLASAGSSRASHARLASFAARGAEMAASASANGRSDAAFGAIANHATSAAPGETSPPALTGGVEPTGSSVLSPFLAAASGGGGAQ
ncbi:MAG TPA: sigma-70 family RNA polymerase sigma factor, partial [Solirubrobacteraceae bacterium]|nr:sigma-70 family RNA polymerase sigma factor [Solirubrobacteraceae bacterium]